MVTTPWVKPADGLSLSVDDRREFGRSRRSVLPRSELAEFAAAEQRRDPVSMLRSQAISRIPELVPIRYGRMLASPWAFLRGAVLLMASDLAAAPHTGLSAQLCGDAPWAISGCSAHPSAAWYSTSTISTRPCPDPGSGMSSASCPASRSPPAKTASRNRSENGWCAPSRGPIASVCMRLRRCANWTSGMRRPVSTTRCRPASARRSPKNPARRRQGPITR